MTITNTNSLAIDIPEWDQLAFCPATGIAGTCLCDDNKRYIYSYLQTATTTAQFWRYDTWADCWQQLATPPTQTGTVASMFYTENIGSQWSGKTYGSIYLFVGNGTICYLYKYDIATNIWTTLNTTNVPATFATDAYLMSPTPNRNGWSGNYHSGVLQTITLTAPITVGTTTVTVSALPEALAANTRLRFGTFDVTLTSPAIKGASNLSVLALPQSLASGTVLSTPDGNNIILSSAASAGSTSISILPLLKYIPNNTVITIEQYIVVTVAAAAAATSITISPSLYSISNSSTALYYGNVYLIGNSATQIYRYNIGTAVWSTTSANSGNPALAALPGTIAQGCAIKWLPLYSLDKLVIIRGAGNATIYLYDLVTNTSSTLSYYPQTEGYTTGTCVAARTINGKQSTLLIQKDTTMRIYELNLGLATIEPKLYQYIYPTSSSVVGDRSCCVMTPEGIEFYYILLHSSTAFVRALLIDQ